eukprot:161650_1
MSTESRKRRRSRSFDKEASNEDEHSSSSSSNEEEDSSESSSGEDSCSSSSSSCMEPPTKRRKKNEKQEKIFMVLVQRFLCNESGMSDEEYGECTKEIKGIYTDKAEANRVAEKLFRKQNDDTKEDKDSNAYQQWNVDLFSGTTDPYETSFSILPEHTHAKCHCWVREVELNKLNEHGSW